jgi:hypothetical protein
MANARVTDRPESESRRHFFRVGFMGALALSTASAVAVLAGCSTPPTAKGFRVLRDSDLKVLRALIPVVLAGAMPAGDAAKPLIEETMHALDAFIYGTSRAGHKQIGQLFDLLSMPATRYAVAGLHEDWDKSSVADITAFLERWKTSRFDMLRGAYTGVTQMIVMNWYMQPRAWTAINYIPPRVVV